MRVSTPCDTTESTAYYTWAHGCATTEYADFYNLRYKRVYGLLYLTIQQSLRLTTSEYTAALEQSLRLTTPEHKDALQQSTRISTTCDTRESTDYYTLRYNTAYGLLHMNTRLRYNRVYGLLHLSNSRATTEYADFYNLRYKRVYGLLHLTIQQSLRLTTYEYTAALQQSLRLTTPE